MDHGATCDLASERVVLLELSSPGEAIRLPGGSSIMGRGPSCFIRVNDPAVSRAHAELRLTDELAITDLGSRNGTLVNGRRIVGQHVLGDGDRITLGDRTYTVRCEGLESFSELAPTGTERSGTLLGVATIQQSCPSCGSPLSLDASRCPCCPESWPAANEHDSTEDKHPSVGGLTAHPQRRFPRYRVSLPVRYVSPGLAVETVALDLSLGGVFVSTSKLDELAAQCSVIISDEPDSPPTTAALRAGRAMIFRGFVRNLVHRGRTGMGIEFEHLDERQRTWVERHATSS